jgi:hypothetical protein
MNGKMMARDRSASRWACGCCQDFAYNRGKGRKKDRRQARRRERDMFREGYAGRWEI